MVNNSSLQGLRADKSTKTMCDIITSKQTTFETQLAAADNIVAQSSAYKPNVESDVRTMQTLISRFLYPIKMAIPR